MEVGHDYSCMVSYGVGQGPATIHGSIWSNNQQVFVYGGFRNDNSSSHELWILETSSLQWVKAVSGPIVYSLSLLSFLFLMIFNDNDRILWWRRFAVEEEVELQRGWSDPFFISLVVASLYRVHNYYIAFFSFFFLTCIVF